MTFGSSSSLERIGVSCFEGTRVEEVRIPDSVRELCDSCFKWCSHLRQVTFGSSSSLERVGVSCFEFSGVEDVVILNGVREIHVPFETRGVNDASEMLEWSLCDMLDL